MAEEFGSSEAGKKGGVARAEKLTREKRQEIARQAANARWGKDLPQASHEGVIELGNVEIPCAVIDDGKRLITQSGFMVAQGAPGKRRVANTMMVTSTCRRS